MLSSDPFNGIKFSPNNHTIWYTQDKCISSYPHYGFIKVVQPSLPSISLKFFSVNSSANDLLQSIVNYLHSRYKLEGIRFQLYLFKGVHLVQGTSNKYEYYFYIYLSSTVPLSLSCYDCMSATNINGIDMGGYLLLMSGFMPGNDCLDTSGNPTLIFPNYLNQSWNGVDSPPDYSPNDSLDIVKIFGTIVNNAQAGTDVFFTFGTDCAFFDSIDADFGEIQTPLPDASKIMDEILNQNKPLSYFLTQYPDMMEEYYENVMALVTFAARNQYPYLPVE